MVMFKLAVLLVVVVTVHGWARHKDEIPNGEAIPDPCDPVAVVTRVGAHSGHDGGVSGGLSQFGMDFRAAGMVWTAALCMMDSDGDGMLNGVELGDPNCEWSNGDASPGPVLGHPGVCEPIGSAVCRAKNDWLTEENCPPLGMPPTTPGTTPEPTTPSPSPSPTTPIPTDPPVECTDSLSMKNFMNVTNANGKVVDTIKNCNKLVKMYPAFCAEEGGEGGRCCEACKAVNLDCLDKAMTFTFGGKMYPSCAKFISRNKCECDEHRDNCCASCEDIVTDALGCSCRDLLSKAAPAMVKFPDGKMKKYTKCKPLIKKYPVKCRELGDEDNVCCKSCDGVGRDCQDELVYFDRGSKTFKGCKLLVKKNKCECADDTMRDVTCCKSCMGVNTDGCDCQDTLTKDMPITLTTLDSDGNATGEILITSCAKLVKLNVKYPSLCETHGQLHGKCCKSCPK